MYKAGASDTILLVRVVTKSRFELFCKLSKMVKMYFCFHNGLAHFPRVPSDFRLLKQNITTLDSILNGGSARGNSMGRHCGPIKGLFWELRPLHVIAEALCRSRGLLGRLGAPGEAIWLLNLVGS